MDEWKGFSQRLIIWRHAFLGSLQNTQMNWFVPKNAKKKQKNYKYTALNFANCY